MTDLITELQKNPPKWAQVIWYKFVSQFIVEGLDGSEIHQRLNNIGDRLCFTYNAIEDQGFEHKVELVIKYRKIMLVIK